ncbi:autotransporter outer membrane beta-barrel domain-containing protein [Neokomagataea anthophila]|uniref:Autotransporter domain-containing protein n=1 Tax=Neokomagataea anthophila TaxID=2826925 RepID=A0ABS5E4S0_9PROT|nr:autotransporter domain-containing protein [Neokomagataea anthophila]MBR0558898.1 autotransporter domain-containing protein [Neokomagataea anthophila]
MSHNKKNRSLLGYRATLLSMTVLACTSHAGAQSIPLDIISEQWTNQSNGPLTTGYRLGINVGVNGGQPEEYLFDTGSDSFNIDVGNGSTAPSWFPTANTQQSVASLTPYMYGDGTYGYLLNPTTVQSIQFFNSSTGKINSNYNTQGGLPVAAAPYYIATMNSLPGQPGIQINNPTLTNAGFTTQPYYQDLTWQQNIDQGQPPEEGHFFGTFGAGDFGNGVPGMLTKSGYIVEANGTASTPGSCGSACMILGLTPALRAQFFSIVPWAAGAQGTFALSGAQSSTEFDTLFKYTLSSNGQSSSKTLLTLLDSGTPSIVLTDSGLYQGAVNNGTVDPNADPYSNPNAASNGNLRPGITLTTLGYGTGNQSENLSSGDDYSGDESNTITVAPSDNEFNPPSAINGISFYFHNAVMYDLKNAATGYTPFYVTSDNFSNGLDITNAMGPLGVAGIISGKGSVTVEQNAIAYLTGANTYTGATTIAAKGWLGIGGPGSIASSSIVQNNGTLDLTNSWQGQEIQSLSGSGTVLLGKNTLVLTNANNTFSGALQNFYTPGSVTTSEPYPVTYALSSGAKFGGLIIASGQETLSGNNTYTGDTGIGANASLILNGSLGQTTVQNAGVFINNGKTNGLVQSTGFIGGTGSFTGGLNVVSGIVSPGTPSASPAPGAFNVSFGNLTLGQNATYLVQTQGANSSRITVDGQATLNGATVSAPVSSGTRAPVLGQSYTILTAMNGVYGRFGQLSSNLTGPSGYLPFLTPSLSYTANSVSLDISRSNVLFSSAATNRNEYSAGSALDALPATLALTTPLTQLNIPEARQALRALAGEVHASVRTALIQDASDIRDTAVERLRTIECAPGAGLSAQQSASYSHGVRIADDGQCHTDRQGLWMQSYGEWSHNAQTANAAGLHNQTGGFILGADTTAFQQWHLGALFAYGHSGFSADSGQSASGQSNNFSLGAYGGRRWKKLGLNIGATYTFNAMTMNRNVDYLGVSDRNSSHYNGGTAQAFADLGYRLTFRRINVEPFANAAYVNQNTNPFTEQGGATAISGANSNTGVAFTTFGSRFATDLQFHKLHVQPQFSAGYRHAFGNITPTVHQYFWNGSSNFEAAGIPLAQDAAVVSAGAQAKIANRLNLNLQYSGQYGSRYTQSGIHAALNYRF